MQLFLDDVEDENLVLCGAGCGTLQGSNRKSVASIRTDP
jgi:hypothetical protein